MNRTRFNLFIRFLKFLLPYRSKWLAILALNGLGALLGLVNPYLTKLVVDKAIWNKDLRTFIILALIGGGVFVLSGVVNGIKDFLDRYIKFKVRFEMHKKVFKHMQNFSLSWFQDKSTGEHLYRVEYDIDTVANFITTTLPQAISVFPRLLCILAIVFYLNWKMAVFSLCLAPFLYLPPYYFSRRMRKIWENLIKNSEDIFKYLEETFSHLQLVKVFAKETTTTRNYLKKLIRNIRIQMGNIKLEILSGFTAGVASKVIMGLISFYGGYQVIKGRMTLGSLTAIMVYLNQLMGLQGQIASFFQTTVLGQVSCKRVAQVLDEQPQIVEAKDAKRVIFKKAEVRFKDISFGYRPQEYVLRDISFSIGSGSHIALVGPSGCGKTTILSLLLRLYDPWKGEIFIDGYNIKDLKLSSLKEQIGIALQEPFLWNDSIENNIRYAKEDANREGIIRVAQMTGVDEFVKDLPAGYETIIGENACKISEGQKQRIAIARALVKKPKILILDEAMSSLDSASEERILLNIKQNQKDTTLIIVSHRLSAVMSADLVYFFFRPNEMVIDSVWGLLENNKDFFALFAGQNKSGYKDLYLKYNHAQ